jgi:MOSC domain-containing protein YiiM
MQRQEPPIDPGASARRNIVVRNCDLSHLVGRTFCIGEVTLRGLARREREDSPAESLEQATPHECTTPAGYCLVLPRPDLRAMVLTGGTISVGDRIEAL